LLDKNWEIPLTFFKQELILKDANFGGLL
jgi:hypothetical protein